jgi:hypothetical protein
MNTTDKIELLAIDPDDSGTKISFASFLKKDYVAKSMVIYLDSNAIIAKIFFSSNSYGSVEWINGQGLKNSRAWESEDAAKAQSYLTRRYTAILSDGAAGNDYARDLIIPDILENLASEDVAEWIGDVLSVKEYLVPADLSRFANN